MLSDRPYRPGSLVHYRFGVYGGVPMLSNDGMREAMLVAPDGSLVPDQRKAWFTPPGWAPRDPFAPVDPTPAETGGAPRPVLLNGRYRVHQVIRHDFPGSVYRATDQSTGAAVIVKQARPHAGADIFGGEVRDRRRHETEMLRRFAATGFTARLVDLFEQQGDLFLVQEQLPGATLRQWVSTTVVPDDGGPAWGVPLPEVLRTARDLVDLIRRVHQEGFVLRDLSPNNIMVTDDGLRLIDLEAFVPVGATVPRLFTPGYGAPEQTGGAPVGPVPVTADLYALGAVLFHLASAVDPVLVRDDAGDRPRQDRLGRWLDQLAARNPAARRLAPVIRALTRDDPDRRPRIDEVAAALAGDDPEPVRVDAPDRPVDRVGQRAHADVLDLKQLVADATDHLVATMRPEGSRLWAPGPSGAKTDPLNVQHGAAGVLGVLVRAYQAEPDEALRTAVAGAADWISRRICHESRLLPGLHYGRSGTAWALLEAGETLGAARLTELAADLAARVPLRWPNPDVCHGTAGAGLTQLRMWEVTGRDVFLDRAGQAAEALADAAHERDVLLLWPVPPEFPSLLAGAAHYGFAHGVAGVASFLLAVGRATGNERYLDLAARAGRTLRSVAEVSGGSARWASSPKGGQLLTHWCSGSSGIGTFLVRLWRHDGDDRWLDLLDQAARAVHGSRWHAGPGQCHGLAGDGEFLLDLADASGDERYRSWAEDLVTSSYVQNVLRDGRVVLPDESRNSVLAEFSAGMAGVLALLLRLRDGGPRLWLPETFARIR
ncbi:class IV lanthionine synthetase LanL [Micromonospora sp. NPDC048830]|uniref:class IV lanthionine synthetase LanL n=1 Tax=Micromonospora sp. NPDC048830 TaxID=3364257 RepID=UPI00370FB787